MKTHPCPRSGCDYYAVFPENLVHHTELTHGPSQSAPGRPNPGESQMTRTYCEACQHDYKTRLAYTTHLHYQCPACWKVMAPILEFTHECGEVFTNTPKTLGEMRTGPDVFIQTVCTDTDSLNYPCTAMNPYQGPAFQGTRCELKQGHPGMHQNTNKWDHEDYQAFIENPDFGKDA